MANDPGTNRTVWNNLYRLVLPHKKTFLWVVTLCLLSTGANLIEPLIYREAINDVAGLFINQAKEDTKKEMGVPPGEEEVAVTDTNFRKKPLQKSARLRATHRAKPKIKEPHSRTHVAPRSPDQALDTLLWA